MATLKLEPAAASPVGSNFPAFVLRAGSNYPVGVLLFDASTDEACSWSFQAKGYSSGNLTATILWYGDTATSGDVVWAAQIAAITPNTDTQDIETDGLAAASTVTDSHLTTTAKRVHSVDLTISNLDSLAADDWVTLKLYRDANNPSDTMTGDACLIGVVLTYT